MKATIDCLDVPDTDPNGCGSLRWKWILVNYNQVWAKKMWILLTQMQKYHPAFYQQSWISKDLYEKVLMPFFTKKAETTSLQSQAKQAPILSPKDVRKPFNLS